MAIKIQFELLKKKSIVFMFPGKRYRVQMML